ncbi:hypothetical protein [Roseibium sp. SCP14]|uniref:hypothetical protein n=1 Tax=Roseibium sp. SCP14 TaxID=3141375 RepID=UPI003336CA5A
MCTIGAIILGPDEYLLYKNKDFGQLGLEEKITSTPQLFGIAGVETFARLDAEEIVYSGLSLGMNAHGLLCCDAHVDFQPENGVNYDRLVEVALNEGQDVPSAIASLEAFVGQTPVWAGNLVLTDGRVVASVEARGALIHAQYSEFCAVKTNHHETFPTQSEPASESSCGRLVSATTRLAQARGLDDVFGLLKSHDAGGTGICNHLEGRRTVFSYVLHVVRGRARMYVSEGLPCEAERYVSFDIPFSERWSTSSVNSLLSCYPQVQPAERANGV